MRIFITGEKGQLGQALQKVLSEQGFTLLTLPHKYDVADHHIVQQIGDLSPEVVIHCAAMTHVDGCAADPDAAFRVNAFGSQNVAHACMRSNADLVYISSNEVFDGQATTPYNEASEPNPINPYGSSKRAGEKMAARYQRKIYVVRTAWLYSAGGNNFPTKILAAAKANKSLRVVQDEISNPTFVPDLAAAIAKLIKTRAYGVYNLVNEGYCSRYEFAQEILRLNGLADMPIEPILLADYQRASTVPPFTPLVNIQAAKLGIQLRPWREALADCISVSQQ